MRSPVPRYALTASWIAALLLAVSPATARAAEPPRLSKDIGPASAGCDALAKGSPIWMTCVGAATIAMPDTERLESQDQRTGA